MISLTNYETKNIHVKVLIAFWPSIIQDYHKNFISYLESWVRKIFMTLEVAFRFEVQTWFFCTELQRVIRYSSSILENHCSKAGHGIRSDLLYSIFPSLKSIRVETMTSSRKTTWTLMLIAVVVGLTLIVTTNAIGNEIYEQRGIKSANGGKKNLFRTYLFDQNSNFQKLY